jgi:2-methylcitrate dehydratase
LSMQRAMRGFVGPADIFRNAEAIFCLFEPPSTAGRSPFDLELATGGDDFAVMGMHFKLGLYEHQSAGAIQGLIDLLTAHPEILSDIDKTKQIRVRIYQPAFHIIGDLAKRDPRTRQSADHSMVYILATLLRKALQRRGTGWRELMLVPDDYSESSLQDRTTGQLMDRIEFVHGGPDYDAKYPDGIPTSLEIEHVDLGTLSSGLVMYPVGHARNRAPDLDSLLRDKFHRLAGLGTDDTDWLYQRLTKMAEKSAEQVECLYDFPLCQENHPPGMGTRTC